MPETLTGTVPAGWELTTLGGVCERGGGDIQTGPFGSQLHASDYVSAGIPSIMPQNIGDNRVVADGIARISEADARRLDRYLVRPGDIVYSRRGDVERRALIRDEQDGWLCGTGCLRVRLGTGVVDPAFAAFYLAHPAVRAWITQRAVGATMPNLNTAILSAVPFLLPPLPEQHRIASILGSLDDKIELNRRMNQTLESVARAIFRSWFVDFDPVRKKMEGTTNGQLGLPRSLAALFPSTLVASILGPIPEGWRVSEIGQEVQAVGGSTPSTANEAYWNGAIAFATPKDLAGLSAPVLLHTERLITEAGAATISSGVLEPGVVLMSSRAPIGYLALNEVPVCVNQGFIAMRCQGALSGHYVLHWARSSMESIRGNANGTTFLEISKRNFRPLPVLVPPPSLVDRFTAVADGLHQRVVGNVRENETLVDMRDALLPRLLDGRLRARSGLSLTNQAVVAGADGIGTEL
jgi:type I restriction enzyme S subunit